MSGTSLCFVRNPDGNRVAGYAGSHKTGKGNELLDMAHRSFYFTMFARAMTNWGKTSSRKMQMM